MFNIKHFGPGNPGSDHIMYQLEISPEETLIFKVTGESIEQFKQLVNRALNCWDGAPRDLKDLGDILTHGKVMPRP